MIDLDSQEVLHWINIYAVIFSILILSLSINFTFFIKDKINRILSMIVCITVICWIFSNEVFEKNIFFGIIPFCISLIALIILIGRLIYKRKK